MPPVKTRSSSQDRFRELDRRVEEKEAAFAKLNKRVAYTNPDGDVHHGIVKHVNNGKSGPRIRVEFESGESMTLNHNDENLRFSEATKEQDKTPVKGSAEAVVALCEALSNFKATEEETFQSSADVSRGSRADNKLSVNRVARKPDLSRFLPKLPSTILPQPVGAQTTENGEVKVREITANSVKSALQASVELTGARPVEVQHTITALQMLYNFSQSKCTARFPGKNQMYEFQTSIMDLLLQSGDRSIQLLEQIQSELEKAKKHSRSNSQGDDELLNSLSDYSDGEEFSDDELREHQQRRKFRKLNDTSEEGYAFMGSEDAVRGEVALLLQEWRTILPEAWKPKSTLYLVLCLQSVLKVLGSIINLPKASTGRAMCNLIGMLRCGAIAVQHVSAVVYMDACKQALQSSMGVVASFCVLEDLKGPHFMKRHIGLLVQTYVGFQQIWEVLSTYLKRHKLTQEQLMFYKEVRIVLEQICDSTRHLFKGLALGIGMHAFEFTTRESYRTDLSEDLEVIFSRIPPPSVLSKLGFKSDSKQQSDLVEAKYELLSVADQLLQKHIGTHKSALTKSLPKLIDTHIKLGKVEELCELNLSNFDSWSKSDDWSKLVEVCCVLSFVDITQRSAIRKILLAHAEKAESKPKSLPPKSDSVKGNLQDKQKTRKVNEEKKPNAKRARTPESKQGKTTKQELRKFMLVKCNREEDIPAKLEIPSDNTIVLVGRAKECDLRFVGQRDDKQLLTISRKCAEFSSDGTSCKIVVTSTFPLLLNGRRLDKNSNPTFLEYGDKVRFCKNKGKRTFEYQLWDTDLVGKK